MAILGDSCPFSLANFRHSSRGDKVAIYAIFSELSVAGNHDYFPYADFWPNEPLREALARKRFRRVLGHGLSKLYGQRRRQTTTIIIAKLSTEDVLVQVLVAELALGVVPLTQVNKLGHLPINALEFRRRDGE